MNTEKTEYQLIMEAGDELRRRGLTPTPARVEGVVNAARGTKQVTVAEVKAMVNALCEKYKPAEPARTVVGLFLSPRSPAGDGKAYAANDEYGGVRKAIRVGPKPARQYMPIARQDALERAPDHAPGSIPPGPTAPDELAALKTEAAQLKAAIADHATGAVDRTRMAQRLDVVRQRIEQLEAGLHPGPQAGAPATAGQARQYAATAPHFQLSGALRAEYAAEVAALKVKIAAPGLLPVQKLRLEQELQHLEHLLQMDASTTPDPRPYQERLAGT